MLIGPCDRCARLEVCSGELQARREDRGSLAWEACDKEFLCACVFLQDLQQEMDRGLGNTLPTELLSPGKKENQPASSENAVG